MRYISVFVLLTWNEKMKNISATFQDERSKNENKEKLRSIQINGNWSHFVRKDRILLILMLLSRRMLRNEIQRERVHLSLFHIGRSLYVTIFSIRYQAAVGCSVIYRNCYEIKWVSSVISENCCCFFLI